jgi:hypothetical protein
VKGHRLGLISQFFGGSISGESALRAGEGNRTLASGAYRGGSLNQEAIYGPRLLWVSEAQVMLLNDLASHFSPITSHGRASGLAVCFQDLFLAFS